MMLQYLAPRNFQMFTNTDLGIGTHYEVYRRFTRRHTLVWILR